MIPVSTFAGLTVAVFGLARSGLAAGRALLAGGARVAAWDDGETARQKAAAAGLPLVDLSTADWRDFSALILAPGVPLTHPAPHWTVEKARAASVEIIGDTELFFREKAKTGAQSKIIGITGTNGKSTSTALTAHVLRQAGLRVAMGGNIGEAVLGLPPFADIDAYVLEMSSYQIDLAPSGRCYVAALLNITPDHLDRHGSLDNYAAIKERLVTEAECAVINLDDARCRAIASRHRALCKPVIATSTTNRAGDCSHGFIAKGSSVFLAQQLGPDKKLGDIAHVGALRGTHNMQNALAALAIATVVDNETPWVDHFRAFETFPGLAHRLQQVARLGNVLFVNDSKATNADSTEKALSSFDRDIYWIAGGRAKEGGIGSLAPFFPRIACAYLIGEAAESFASALQPAVPAKIAKTLAAAVPQAAADAAASGRPEPVVLLSPACASFDQFADFEARGSAFIEAVRRLPGVEPFGGA